MRRSVLAACALALITTISAVAADRVTVELPQDQAGLPGRGAMSGRMVVFLKSVRSRERGDPATGPFFSDPQPIFSVPVASLKPGVVVEVGAEAAKWPGPMEALDGDFTAQAVFRRSRDEGAVLAPGNLVSEPVSVTLRRDADDTLELKLAAVVPPMETPESPQIAWIDEPSPMLTRALGRVVRHRAAVVFPRGYHDVNHPRRVWPTVYVIPGFGGRMDRAVELARLLHTPEATLAMPQAVHVVLDPEGPFGHHGFADSVMNGPRGAALVQELIPMLEERYRLVRTPEARLVTGHSSGGWSSLWLMLTNPDFFGGCWSSSPDPVDFAAFQQSDLYRDANLFVGADGEDRASFRRPLGDLEKVLMTVREEMGMEHAIDPHGGSGQQWDAWCAMFSPADPATGMPKALCDPATGVVDRALVDDAWSAYDISRLVERRWSRLDPVLRDKVHLLVGDRDNFYLERAVRLLVRKVDALRAATGAPQAAGTGFIEFLPGATHDTGAAIARGRFALDMRRHLKAHGLGD